MVLSALNLPRTRRSHIAFKDIEGTLLSINIYLKLSNIVDLTQARLCSSPPLSLKKNPALTLQCIGD